jgi:predicted AAA+ superfamily ATPase
MQRLLIAKLLKWQALKHQKPILLDGARQVGKPYLLKNAFANISISAIPLIFLNNLMFSYCLNKILIPLD